MEVNSDLNSSKFSDEFAEDNENYSNSLTIQIEKWLSSGKLISIK